jgi:hypothetical protein
MKIHTWITLENVLDEFRDVIQQIAVGIDKVLGPDTMDPRFCIDLESRKGWEPSVAVTNSHI